MQSKAATVSEYLAALPDDRRATVEAVRQVILDNLDPFYAEGMQYGVIGYFVPHSVFPAGYHCDPKQPLPFAALASQKNYLSLYLMGVYCGCVDERETEHARWFREAWTRTGKKLDMGKSCVRFKKLDDLPLDVIGEAFRRMPAEAYIAAYEKALAGPGKEAKKVAVVKKSAEKQATEKKAAAKKPVTRKLAANKAGAAKR